MKPGEFLLSKDLDVALWLDYRMFTNQRPLDEVCDFVVVNEPLMAEFDKFKGNHTSLGFSYLPVTKLLELWIIAQESVDIVLQFGHKYAFLHQFNLDDLVQWLLDTRDHFECEGRDVFHSLLSKIPNQPP